VVDELGTTFYRGNPQQIDERTASLLALAPYKDLFIIDDRPVPLSAEDSRTIAIYPQEAPCVWEGDFAVLTGPFVAVCDDDHHQFRCGEPVEICSKTFRVLHTPHYQPYFANINRAREGVTSEPVICGTSTVCC
jgi:hypothetical protein